jgi:hypothetical protein
MAQLLPGCWWVLSPTRKETSYSDQTLTFANHWKKNWEGCPLNQVSVAAMTSTSDEKWWPFSCFCNWVRLRTYQHRVLLGDEITVSHAMELCCSCCCSIMYLVILIMMTVVESIWFGCMYMEILRQLGSAPSDTWQVCVKLLKYYTIICS